MNLKDSRLKLPTSALRVRLLLALASIVLALMAMVTTAISNLRGGGGGAEFVVVVMGLWALPHALYVIIIRTREMSKVAGLALLITTSFFTQRQDIGVINGCARVRFWPRPSRSHRHCSRNHRPCVAQKTESLHGARDGSNGLTSPSGTTSGRTRPRPSAAGEPQIRYTEVQ